MTESTLTRTIPPFFMSILLLLALFGSVLFTTPDGKAENGPEAEVKALDITTTIENSYATTHLRFSLENPHNESAEAQIEAMIPERAFISNFSLTFGNKTYHGDVIPKEEAQQKYDEAVASGKSAGMVEARDMKHFSFAVNLKAHQTAEVNISYEEFLEKQMGKERYLLPLKGLGVDRIKDFQLTVDIKSSLVITHRQVEGIYSSQTVIEDCTITHTTLSLTKQDFRPEEDFSFVYKERAVPVNGTMLVHYDDLAEEYYFFNLFSPLKGELGGAMSKDIIFVLDKSGSMSGLKIDQLKQAFKEIIDQLPEDDKFTIITFDESIHVYKSKLIETSETNKDSAKDYINDISAGGSTNLYGGLERALSFLKNSDGCVPIIVMLTDGLPTAGEYQAPLAIREKIQEKNGISCPIFCLGFGNDVDMDFLSALSLENYAVAKKIYVDSDASEQITDFYETISTTLLRDIDFRYSDGTYEVYPSHAPSLFEGSDLIVTGRCEGRLDSISSHITAYTQNGKREFRESYELNESEANNSFIKRFWAYAKIYALMDQILVVGEDEALVSQVENLSIDAHFVTPYTSLYLEIEEGGETHDPGDGGDDEEEGKTGQQTGAPPVSYGPYRSSDPDRGYSNGGGGGLSPCPSPTGVDEAGDGFLPGFEILAVIGSIVVAFTLRRWFAKS